MQQREPALNRCRAARVTQLILTGILTAVLALSLVGAPRAQDATQTPGAPLVRVLPLDGAIGPALADFLKREIEQAPLDGVETLIIRMNTPGGLVASMREIVAAILASSVPVVVYVAPQGAHAASAGTYILYASHVAAMAPGTNLGAATPINLGGTPGSPEPAPAPGQDAPKAAPPGAADLKAVNDLTALIKSLADLRGRNMEWAERAVREAATLTAGEAKKANVIELIAPDLSALVAALDGRTVEVGGQSVILRTADARVEHIQIGWVSHFLMLITNPNIAFILMTLGMYGLIFELANPGSIVPGLLGSLCLVLGLYALSVLPVNATGLVLIGLGIVLMLIEAISPGFGIAGLGGLASFALGATFLIDSNDPSFRLAPQTIIAVTATTGAFLMLVVGYALAAQGRRVTVGPESMIGRRGVVTEWDGDTGYVEFDGERWRARSDGPLEPGSEVVIRGIDGLVLSIAGVPRAKPKRSKRS